MVDKIDEQTLERLSRIARITVSEKEKTALRADLNKVLAWAEEIKKLELGREAELAYGVDKKNALREDDVVEASEGKDAIVFGFPVKEDRVLRVPKTL